MFAAGEGHTLRTMEVDHLIQRFQPLIKHRYLAGNIRSQPARLLRISCILSNMVDIIWFCSLTDGDRGCR
jgi:hypothetical protein